MRKYRVDANVSFFVWAESEKQAKAWFESCMEEVLHSTEEIFPEEPCFSQRESIIWENLQAKVVRPEKGEKCPAEEE